MDAPRATPRPHVTTAGRIRLLRRTIAVLAVGAIGLAPAARGADDEIVPLNSRFLVAARNLEGEAIARMLREGANVNSRNRLGESALVIVLKKNRLDLAEVLLAAGADVNLPAVNGITPLMTAAYAGHVDMVKTLLDKGADVAAPDRLKKSAMTYAAGEGHTEVVKLLLARGVDPNAVYEHGLTALMWAAGYGRVDAMRVLLDAGARADLKDDRGLTARDIASTQKEPAAVQLLELARSK